jgi:hypothetical protein
VAADTALKRLPVLADEAFRNSRPAKLEGKVRLNTQFDLKPGVPIRIDVTESVNHGEADEQAVLGKALQCKRCSAAYRGYPLQKRTSGFRVGDPLKTSTVVADCSLRPTFPRPSHLPNPFTVLSKYHEFLTRGEESLR